MKITLAASHVKREINFSRKFPSQEVHVLHFDLNDYGKTDVDSNLNTPTSETVLRKV